MSRSTDAFDHAFARTRKVLFDPFDATKYLALALCAWLYRLGEMPLRGLGRDGGDMHRVRADLAHTLALGPLVVFAVMMGLLFAAVLVVGLLFLRSRGAFLLLDGIARDRAAIGEAWSAYAPEADSLFRFRLVVVGVPVALGLMLSAVAVVAVASTPADVLATPWVAALAGLGVATVTAAVLAWVTDAVAAELVTPVQYARRCGVLEGFRDLGHLVRHDPGPFAAFVALRLVVAIGVQIVSVLAIVFTCGLAALPFVGTAVLLPLYVFSRASSMYFLASLAPDLAVLGPPTGRMLPPQEPPPVVPPTELGPPIAP